LISALDDEYWLVRSNAAIALGMIGSSKASDALIDHLMYDSDPFVRASSAEALGRIGDPKAADALIQSLQDEESYYVKSKLSVALKNILKNM
jgi:HEAT repeat protein